MNVIERWDRFLDYLFYAGAEVSLLCSPVLTFLIMVPAQRLVSLSAMVGVLAMSLAVAVFRGYVDVGEWPRYGHLTSIPLRAAYYGGTLALGTYLGTVAQAETGSQTPGLVVPIVLSFATMAAFPRVYGAVSRLTPSPTLP